MFSKAIRIFSIVAVLALSLAYAPIADAAPKCDRINNTVTRLLECVTVEGVREHQAAFQAIADANGGTRAAGTPGYDASVDYVVERLTAAGYNVSLDEFPFLYTPPPVLQQTAPITATYEGGSMTGTDYGSVSANVTAVDVVLALPRDPVTSGCDGAFTESAVGAPIVPHPEGPDDFAGFTPGNIALVQRGGCSFALKVYNAQAAGASAVIIFNQGNTPARSTVLTGTLVNPSVPGPVTVPVVGASFADGEALAQAGSAATVTVEEPREVTQVNVIAESRDGNPNNVVMAGAHLDSVEPGSGINDNGSGSAALLEVAEQMSRVRPRNRIRFAWWGAEESGLLGSTAYVNGLSQEERDRIALYLNFDMVGSPNYVFFIYDGDNSDGVGAPAGPAGSDAIEATFERYYSTIAHEPFKGTDFTGRSDYGPFIAVGIPSGGLFTGAEGVKTAEEAAIWGGTAGQQYDPCYHLVCDTFANVSLHALGVNADAIAYAVLHYSSNTDDVDGPKVRGNTVQTIDLRPKE